MTAHFGVDARTYANRLLASGLSTPGIDGCTARLWYCPRYVISTHKAAIAIRAGLARPTPFIDTARARRCSRLKSASTLNATGSTTPPVRVAYAAHHASPTAAASGTSSDLDRSGCNARSDTKRARRKKNRKGTSERMPFLNSVKNGLNPTIATTSIAAVRPSHALASNARTPSAATNSTIPGTFSLVKFIPVSEYTGASNSGNPGGYFATIDSSGL